MKTGRSTNQLFNQTSVGPANMAAFLEMNRNKKKKNEFNVKNCIVVGYVSSSVKKK